MAELTKNDLKNIKEVFTEALEPFAKAVQKDFQRLDTKIDVNTMKLDNKISKVDFELREVKMDLAEVKRDVQEIKNNSSELFAKLDQFISLYKDTKQELTLMGERLRRLEERIATLESKNNN